MMKDAFSFSKFALVAVVGFAMGCTQTSTKTLVPLQASILAAPPQTISLNINNYKPQTGNKYQNIFVSNFSVVPKNGNIQYSTARDGLTDALKQAQASSYGFGINSPESAVFGFSDLVLFISGVVSSQQSLLSCPTNQQASSANDGFTFNDSRFGGTQTFLGLRDCDKTYVGISTKTFDSNGNGIPDYLELRCGLNPINKTQAFVSTSSDGVTNLDKCRRNIPVSENASSVANQVLGYQYTNQMNSDGSLNFIINNIPVLNNGTDNFIAMYVVETNSNTAVESLYSAFIILPNGFAGKTIKFNYWATSTSTYLNQQITP